MSDGSPWVAIIITIVLIGINGMLASSELAMMGLNEHKLKAKADGGDKKAKLLLLMKQNPSNFLSTIQIGITLAGLLSGAFAADALAKPLVQLAANSGISGTTLSVISGLSTFLITLIMTYFMLVFGELVPKRIAISKPEATARSVIAPIHILSKITKPLVKLLAASTNGILKLIGIDPNHEESPVTEEEILIMMREGQEQGAIEESEVEFVSNLFEFSDLKVKDAFIHRTEIHAIPLSSSISDVAKLAYHTGFNKFPIYDGDLDKIVGIIYTKDITKTYIPNAEIAAPNITDVMRKPFFVHESKSLTSLFSEMRESKNHLAIVVDEYGGTAGMITLMDIIEELLGNLMEEEIKLLDDDSYLMKGSMDLEDVFQILHIEETSDTPETLNSFIREKLGYAPTEDNLAIIHSHGYQFQVEEMDGVRIKWVRIKKDTL